MGYSTTVYIGTYNKKQKRKTIRAKTKEELQRKVKEAKEQIEEEKILAELKEREEIIKQERRNQSGSGYVYLMECNGKYKIGYSRNIKQRLKALNCGLYEVKLISKSAFSEKAYVYEKNLHDLYKEQNIRAEWYELKAQQVLDVKKIIRRIEKHIMIFDVETKAIKYLIYDVKRRTYNETIQKLG